MIMNEKSTQTNPLTTLDQEVAENEIIVTRRHKLQELRHQGFNYPNDFKPTHGALSLHQQFDNLNNEELARYNDQEYKIAGRIMLKRVMGKASFATLKDNGTLIQIYVTRDSVGEEQYEKFKHLDIGDIIGASGTLFKTKTNELTISTTSFGLISKNIYPLPEKFHGLTDQEQKYRKRYLDLIMNDETREIFMARSRIIQTIRECLIRENYLEVETPMMHPIPGGATARPFITKHNALDTDLYLRIAPELYLKRLIVGGINRVFEINRSFRNEGLSTRHNPEFTMVEFYESYANYIRMMELTEAIIKEVTQAILGTLKFNYMDKVIDLSQPFERLTITDAILKYNPNYLAKDLNNSEFLKQELFKLTNTKPTTNSLGVLQLMLFEETTESQLWQPTFIINYPVDTSPLAKVSNLDENITERFELFIVGRELANGYSELNDPEDQANRFKLQVEQKEKGDSEAMHYDADYIQALEYGMPHTGGSGIGIDRLVMLLTNSSSIRDVILFPQLRRV